MYFLLSLKKVNPLGNMWDYVNLYLHHILYFLMIFLKMWYIWLGFFKMLYTWLKLCRVWLDNSHSCLLVPAELSYLNAMEYLVLSLASWQSSIVLYNSVWHACCGRKESILIYKMIALRSMKKTIGKLIPDAFSMYFRLLKKII